jgi:hypothetical protein
MDDGQGLTTDLDVGSVLTPSMRAYLKGESDIESGSSHARMVESRIRSRIRRGFMDCDLILRHLDTEDIQTALELDKDDHVLLDNGVSAAIGMIYLGYIERGPIGESSEWGGFEKRAEKGIRMALNHLNASVKRVDVDVDVELGAAFGDMGDLDAEALAEYSPSELLQALQAGAIDNEQFMVAMDAKGMTIDEE